MKAVTDDSFRGLALGAMFAVGAGAGFLVLVGSLIEGENPSRATGSVLMAAGAAGILTALVVAQGVIRGAPIRAALAASVQALLAVLILCWWVTTDAWEGTQHAALSTVPLVLVILVDAVVIVWAWLRLRSSREAQRP